MRLGGKRRGWGTKPPEALLDKIGDRDGQTVRAVMGDDLYPDR